MSKKHCFNDADTKYSGNEDTPLGFGICSKAEVPYTFLTGKDTNLYYISQVNNKKSISQRWTKVENKKLSNTSNDLLYQNITEDIANERYFSKEFLEIIANKKKKYNYDFLEEENKWFYWDTKNPSDKKEIKLDSMPNDMEFFKDLPDEFYTYFYQNLPEELYNYAFLPKIIEKDIKYIETGLENKIGGKVPFFTTDEEWPITDDDKPMTFVAQFSDPRENKPNMIYRIFICFNDIGEYKIDYVDKTQTQKIIQPPKYFEDFEDLEDLENREDLEDLENREDSTLQNLFLIDSWTKIRELTSFDKIMKVMNIPEIKLSSIINKEFDYIRIIRDETIHKKFETHYYDYSLSPKPRPFKVGGTPIFCDHYDIEQYKIYEETQLLEIRYSKCIPYSWGDSGAGHIFKSRDKNNGKILTEIESLKEYYLLLDTN